MKELRFRVVKTAGGWDGTLTLPFEPGVALPSTVPPGAKGIAVTERGAPSKNAAAKGVAKKALKMLDNPAVQAVMPPQARIALKVMKKVPFGKLKKLF